jgi:hypothetical protein
MQFESPFFDTIWQHKVRFLAVFFVIFTFSYGVLYALDWLPEPKSAKEMVAMNATTTTATTTQSEEEETPAESVDDAEEPAVFVFHPLIGW